MKSRYHLSLFFITVPLWLLLFFIIPTTLILGLSFFESAAYGNIKHSLTIDNFSFIFNQTYYKIITRTLIVASLNGALCLLLGYPLAYFISEQKTHKRKSIFLILVLLPFWTNFLIRTISWMFILGNNGILNLLLIKLNIISTPIELLFTPFAVQFGLIYNYMPLMIITLYSSIEGIDKKLYLASSDLGANAIQSFVSITLPLSKQGILTGFFFVFIPTLGEFIIPDLLGGGKFPMIGNIIKNQFLLTRNWPQGSAFILLIMIAILVTTIIKNRLLKKFST